MLPALPAAFASTRDGLHALACYAIAPARKARTERIGLRSTGDGFGTPPFEDGSRIAVVADHLRWEPGRVTPIVTVRHAATFLGIEPQPDPGVGGDLPPYRPDAPLNVDAAASLALGAWYAFGQRALDRLTLEVEGSVSEAQLWPEHFDLAVTIDLHGGPQADVGFSPGDTFHTDPYVYVSPHDREGLKDPYWNAPFGAYLRYAELALAAATAATAATAADDPVAV